jgi:glycine/D-amino acid oxidase-like deaminating enzyme
VTSSYWLSERPFRRPHPAVADPDVVVVGGGVTGCSAALQLARSGLSVRLYDAREIAGGASGRNGGFALRGAPAPLDVTIASVGAERAHAIWAWTEQAISAIEGLAGDAFRRVGSLRLAVDAEERDELRLEYDALVAGGFAAEWIEHVEPPLEGRFTAAIRHVPDGVLQPARWVRRLAGLAADAGVEIREHERIESLEELDGATVVVCPDGYPSGLLGPIEGLIIPTRGQVIATEPIPERYFEVPHYGRHGFDYWHQTPDGRIIAGGFRDVALDSEFTADERLTVPVQAALKSFVDGLLGRELRIDYAWAGIFGMVMDFLPVVGPVPGLENVWVAGGYSGHGNVLGFACGELVARAVAGGHDPLLESFDPARLLNEG